MYVKNMKVLEINLKNRYTFSQLIFFLLFCGHVLIFSFLWFLSNFCVFQSWLLVKYLDTTQLTEVVKHLQFKASLWWTPPLDPQPFFFGTKC